MTRTIGPPGQFLPERQSRKVEVKGTESLNLIEKNGC
jgi:hypothetical protein